MEAYRFLRIGVALRPLLAKNAEHFRELLPVLHEVRISGIRTRLS